MADHEDPINAIIAAALMQSGAFRFSDFDHVGRVPEHMSSVSSADESKFRLTQGDVLGRFGVDPSADWRETAALTTLRRFTEAVRRALYEDFPRRR